MDLTKLARPWTESDGDIPCDWAQRRLHGKPVIADRIEDLVGRVSVCSVGGTTLLRLWDPGESLGLGDVLAGLQQHCDGYSVALSPASRAPIETGYLECMHLVPAPDGITADEAIAAFSRVQRDRYADMERHLVDCYGELTPERASDGRFKCIDYPSFDLGPVTLGFGLFVEHMPHRHLSIWCWSRVVNWHK